MTSSDSKSATMDELHEYIRQQASNSTQVPSQSSIFLGHRRLQAKATGEPIARVMFRCQFPLNSASRHVLLHLKPSFTEEALAMKLCEVFEIPASGGVIMKTMPNFMAGRDPITDPSKVYSRAELHEFLGSSKAGFMEVTVQPLDAMSICTNCGTRTQGDITPAVLQNIRKWCYGVEPHCGKCCRTKGVSDNAVEMRMPDGQTFSRLYL